MIDTFQSVASGYIFIAIIIGLFSTETSILRILLWPLLLVREAINILRGK